MKWIKIVGALGVLAGICSFAQTHPNGANQSSSNSGPDYAISLAAPAGPIRIGAPIVVTVTVTNITDHEIALMSSLSKDSPYTDFEFRLTRDGREAEATFFHRKVSGRLRPDDPQEVMSGSAILFPHPPGKIFVIPVDLNRLYEITEPGLYTFSVSRYDGREGNRIIVRSKPLILKIVR